MSFNNEALPDSPEGINIKSYVLTFVLQQLTLGHQERHHKLWVLVSKNLETKQKEIHKETLPLWSPLDLFETPGSPQLSQCHPSVQPVKVDVQTGDHSWFSVGIVLRVFVRKFALGHLPPEPRSPHWWWPSLQSSSLMESCSQGWISRGGTSWTEPEGP